MNTQLARRIGLGLGYVIGTLVILVTIASDTDSNQWWVRVWDFPRLIIFFVGLAVVGLLAWLRPRRAWLLLVPLAGALLYQAWRIAPYTILWPVEAQDIADADIADRDDCFSLLSLNVLQDNRDYARTLELVREADPDLLLLMETDRQWMDALGPVLARYDRRYEAPLSNKYGLVLATRLPVDSGGLVNLVEPSTPSVHVIARTPSGHPFNLVALHPRPPHPGYDTEDRDAELIVAANMIRNNPLPAIAVGDFNDVGWSDTSRRFSRVGQLADPRVGRGFFATFPASWPAFRWPLDQLFFTEEFALRRMDVGSPVGSDHLPVMAELCLIPAAGEALNEIERPSAEDLRSYEQMMEDYREDRVQERRSGD